MWENVMLKKIKDILYYYFAEKNWGVRREYGPYVDAHREEHQKHRWKHWWLLIRLNWHYRVLRRNSYLTIANSNRSNSNTICKRLPYIGGPENELCKRLSPVHFARELLQFDVISFDIFDTLILRPFKQPQDLFYIVGKRLNFCGFNESFFSIRRSAEITAREVVEKRMGHREVNIYDIYEQISHKTDISVELGVNTEFGVEMDYCFANPYMYEVFRILRAQGKKIVILSDMYLPESMIKQILKKNGYYGFDKIYISCDYNCSKARGTLYDVLKNDYKYPMNKIVHIGGNKKSDIFQAEKKHIFTKHYQNVHEIGNKYRPDNMTSLIGSIYSGIVNTHLHNGNNHYSFYYEYGFTFVGLYIYGMCQWINKILKEKKIDKLIFLSRDGWMYNKVFDYLFPEVNKIYCPWSRNAAMKCVVVKRNFEEFVNRYVDYRINDSDSHTFITIESFLETLEISELDEELIKYGLTKQTPLTKNIKNSLHCFLNDHKDYLIRKYEKNRDILGEVYSYAVNNCKHVALIDVGWSGHNLLTLKYFIQNNLQKKCKITCLMAFEKAGINIPDLLEENIEAYIASTFHNRDIIWKYHNKTNSKINTPFFEIPTQTTQPSFSGISQTEEFIYDIPTVEDHKIINQIEKGVLDFCKKYDDFTKHDQYLRNIPGIDAYSPFSMAVKSIKFIQENFKTMHISFNIGGDLVNQKIETFGEQISVFQGDKRK